MTVHDKAMTEEENCFVYHEVFKAREQALKSIRQGLQGLQRSVKLFDEKPWTEDRHLWSDDVNADRELCAALEYQLDLRFAKEIEALPIAAPGICAKWGR